MTTIQPNGHLSLPRGDFGDPVLVLHPWWGLNDTMRRYCDRLAEAGYVAFAPDLFDGRTTDSIAEAEQLVEGHDGEATAALVAEAIRFLDERTGRNARGVAVVGFSFGAWYAVQASLENPERVRAVVVYYGAAPVDFSASQAAYLGHFAADDVYEPQEYVDEMEANLRAAGRPAAIHVYPDTGHWFAEPDRLTAYNADAEQLAWSRTLEFLRGYFTGAENL